MTPDPELLRHYVEHRDEAAFAEIVRRQVDLVYSVALRVARGDAHLAEDVTQRVFIQLARSAGSVCRHPAIIGWLHVTARHTAIKAIRGEQRRRVREQEASAMHDPNPPAAVPWEQLRPLLDEAVERLPARDRDAVLLRFFQGLSHREIGDQLGLTEDTARKRIERSLEKLRVHFTRRGVGVSAGLLAETIEANSVQAAPAGLSTRVTGPSLASASGAGLSGAMLRILFMSTKPKVILAGGITLAVVAGLIFTLRQPTESPPSVKTSDSLTGSNAPHPVVLPTARPPAILPPVTPPAPARNAASSTTATAESTNPFPDDQTKIDAATTFVTQSIGIVALSYKMAMGHYPSTEDGLRAFLTCPTDENAASWKGPYFNTPAVPLDPWGHTYEYAYPSIHGLGEGRYDVWSDGPDGINGSADNIGNWEK
jgi:type II secretion system protein G